MKLSPGIKNFWWVIGSQAGIAIGLALFASWNINWLIAVLILGTAVILLTLQIKGIKTQILAAVPQHWDYQPVDLESLTTVDLEWVKQQTHALEQLGFIQLRDYSIPGNPGVARSFAHPQDHCFVEIGQLVAATGELSYHTAIFSDLEQDWSLSHLNRPVCHIDSLTHIWRHPRWVKQFTPCPSLAELLQTHLQFRRQMMSDLGIRVATDPSWAAYEVIMRRGIENLQRRLRAKPLLIGMVEATLFELNLPSEWLGDYAPKVAQQRRR